EALNMAETMIKASKSHLYSTLTCQIIAIAGYSMGTQTWQYLISRCNDQELLRYTLIRQNELALRKDLASRKIVIGISDSIGMIRMAQKFGIVSNIEGKSRREIYGEWFRVEAEFQEKVVIPLVSNPSEIAGIMKRVSGYRMTSTEFGTEVTGMRSLKYKLISPVIGPLYCQFGVPNYLEFLIRERAAITKFGLLRLYTAKKLYLLEHKKEPEKMEDLVPEYIPELLMDPFSISTKQPFPKESFFYSIGPDNKDQKGAFLYDPTNGTVTPGDIYFILNNIP
ncbi:hypothetical protein JW926_16595, partial [Candidatus Sumerlaeota bacterium]|nr:hypothetical protein [Candidatus Sumerlaeota bacterium]